MSLLNDVALRKIVEWVNGKLLNKADKNHTHTIANVNGLQSTLDSKAATNHTHSAASSTTNGFLSKEDKVKLDGIEAGANKFTMPSKLLHTIIDFGATGISFFTPEIKGSIDNSIATKADARHTHAAANIVEDDEKKFVSQAWLDEQESLYSAAGEWLTKVEAKADANTLSLTGKADSNHNHNLATQSMAGFLSPGDKTKIDGIPSSPKYTDTTYALATTSTAGLLSNTDKIKLDAIPANPKYTDTNTVTTINGKTGAITKADIVALGIPSTDTNTTYSPVTTTTDGLMLATDKVKLDSVPTNAKYTDTITTINGKTGAITKADIVALGIPATDTNTVYTHPTNHPASIITQDANNRFVTDAEKALWDAKQNELVAGANITIANGTISAVDTVYDDTDVQSHMSSKTNPHGVTKAQVGLGNVSNVAQASKTEFNSHNSDTTKHITASERTAWNNKQNALGFTPENASNKSKAGGYASLDSSGKVPASELPSYVDDVVEATTLANLPTTGETGKIYVTTGNNKTYRWSGTGYTEISASLALGTTSSTAYRGDLGNTAYVHSQATGNPHGTTKAQIGLGNVDNTSDANKPVSTAMQSALNDKADKSQVLTNVPANAKFTDTNTTYSEISTAEIDAGTASTGRTITGRRVKYILDKVSSMISVAIGALTKSSVGLGNVDNTSDTNKPISTATQTALDGKVNNSQVLTNVPSGAKFTDTVTTINGKTGAITKADITALGIPAQDTVYTHPSTHPASMITETSTKRFVTDAEKSTWNSKQNALTAGSNVNISGNTISATNTTYSVATTSTNGLMSAADKVKVNAIPDNPKYTDTNTTYAAMSVAEGAAGTATASRTIRADYLKQIIQSYIPSSLPANGGNAATVGGFTVGTNVPANAKFTDTNTTYAAATTTTAGLMSAADKVKVNAIPASPKYTDTTYNVATTTVNGLMAAADKVKLNGIATGANNYSLPTASDTVLGGIKVGENLSIDNGMLTANYVVIAKGASTADIPNGTLIFEKA